MSLSFNGSWGTEPTNPTTLATLVAFIKSLTGSLTGTIGASDIASAAITSTKVAPEAFLYSGSTYSGGVFTISTLNYASTTFENGLRVVFKASAAATTDDQVNVNSQGTKKLYRMGGTVRVKGGDFRANTLVEIGYNTSLDGAVGGWEILSVLALPDVRYESTTTTGTNDYVATFAPTVPALVDGTRCLFKVPNSNSSTCTFAPDGLTAKSIRRNYNEPLAGGELLAGAMVEVVYDSTNDWWQLITDVSSTVAQPITGDAKNLRITRTSVTRVTVTADELVVKNTSGAGYVVSSLSDYADIGSVGLGGLDASDTETGNTWYYIVALYNPSSGDSGVILTDSSTGPTTVPAGYTYKAVVGIVRNSAAADFVDFEQVGKQVATEPRTIHAGAGVTSITAIALGNYAPPNAVAVGGYIGASTNSNMGVVIQAEDTTGVGQQVIRVDSAGSTFSSLYNGCPWFCVLRSTNLYWNTSSAAVDYIFRITSYTLA